MLARPKSRREPEAAGLSCRAKAFRFSLTMARPKLGELLIKTGYLRPEQLTQALDEQKKWGGRLGRLLAEMRMVQEDIVLKALSKQLGLEIAVLTAPQIPSDILRQIDGNFALSNSLCPERYDQKTRTLRVAMLDHNDVKSIDEMRRRTGVRIEISLAPHNDLGAAIELLYGVAAAPRDRALSTSNLRGGNATEMSTEDGQRASLHNVFETGDFGPMEDEHLTLDQPNPRGKKKR
jgi:hypothetical protein